MVKHAVGLTRCRGQRRGLAGLRRNLVHWLGADPDELQPSELAAMDNNGTNSLQAATEAWRAQSLQALLALGLVVSFPRLLMIAWEWPTPFSPLTRILTLVLYLAAAALALGRRVRAPWRAWAFLCVLYAAAAFQLAWAGMAGSGRITLVSIPLYALLLVGLRSGWVALALGTLVYGGFVVAFAWGWTGEPLYVHQNPADPRYWTMQGVVLLGVAVLMLVLLSRFLGLHARAVEAERRVSERVREEAVMRTAAYEALERATREQRRLEEQIARTSEDERRRLGSELHDGLCQQLTAALLRCVAMENQQAAELPAAPLPLRELRVLLEDSIGTAYEVARGLCPLDVGPDSLGTALEGLARQTRDAAGVACEFREGGDVSVRDQATALHLYRIAQEAVANAARHAHPRRIVITLSGDSECLLLQVEDDGIGMPARQGKSGGMGTHIMAYRAGVLGGTLAVERVPGGGTRIVCRVPRSPGEERSAVESAGGSESSPEPDPREEPTHDR